MRNRELRKVLATALKGFNAYFGDNTGEFVDNCKINYNIVNNILLEGVRTYVVDIDIWHKDNILVDEIADNIEAIFNYNSLSDENWCTFFLDRRLNVDEKNIYRRTLTYEVRTY